MGRVTGLAGAFAGLVVALFGATTPPRPVVAAANAQDQYPKPPADKQLKLVGASICKNCHDQDDPTSKDEYKETRGYEFVRLWENRVWNVHDMHRTAFMNLLTNRTAGKEGEKPNETAQKMEDTLRRSGTDPKYRDENYTVATDTQCLACHASTFDPITPGSHKDWKPASFFTKDGVGCEMCHGHGSLYQDKHKESRIVNEGAPPGAVRIVDWREWSPTAKKEWGLVNLRDPVVATSRCGSCHIGNINEGRFVTHEMFAAGHPPLPPFDLMGFTREQPRHWGLPTKMPYLNWLAKNDAKKAQAIFHFRGDERYAARRFVEATIGSLHALAVSTNQLAEVSKDDGLDFAAFDCYACHHNLKYPSDRQDRGYIGKPGRPIFRPSAFVLTKLVLEHASTMENGAPLKESLDALLKAEQQLVDAFAKKTLGDPVAIAQATKTLTEWTADAMKKLAAVQYTEKETQRLLAMVIAATQKPIGDPEVGQLYVWAFDTLVLELNDPTGDKKDLPPAVDELRKVLQGTVVTRLRPNTQYNYEPDIKGKAPDNALESVDARLPVRMETLNSFRRKTFQDAFQSVKPMLPK